MTDEPRNSGDQVARGVECSGCGRVCDGVGQLANHDCESDQEALSA